MPQSQTDKVRAIEEKRVGLEVHAEPPPLVKKRSITPGQFIFFAIIFALMTYLPVTFMLVMAFPKANIHPIVSAIVTLAIACGFVELVIRLFKI